MPGCINWAPKPESGPVLPLCNRCAAIDAYSGRNAAPAQRQLPPLMDRMLGPINIADNTSPVAPRLASVPGGARGDSRRPVQDRGLSRRGRGEVRDDKQQQEQWQWRHQA